MSSRPSRGAARLAAILDALPDALVLVNANGTVVNANSIALEAFETPGTALVGRGLLDLLPEFDSRLIPGSMRRPDTTDERGRTKPTRMIARRTDGTEFPVEVTSANLEDGQQAYDNHGPTPDELLMLVVRDLSGTVDTEAELARSQRQTEMILRAAAEGVVGTDTEGRVVLVNPAAAQILGYRASDLGGKDLHALILHSRADGEDFPYEESPLADTLRSGRKHRVRGQVLWSKSGDKVPVDLTTSPVRDGDLLVGAVMTFTDRRPYDTLVEEKDAAATRHAEELERIGEEHTAELKELRERHAAELSELSEGHEEELAAGDERYAALGEREKDRYEALTARHEQLLAVLGQSLRGPLDQLRGELSKLAADDAGQLWPEANQVLHHLAAGYSRITTLVDNVLGYQRLDSGAETIVRTNVMLDAVVAAGVDGAVDLIGPGRVQFAVHAPPIEAEVDPQRLAGALAHLIADVAGVDATGNAPVSAGGYMDNTVVVAAAQRGEVVRIEVRGPYAGGDPVHEPIVRGIVRAHGGVLQTHEVPGMSGSAFVLEVPIGDGAGAVPPATGPAVSTEVALPEQAAQQSGGRRRARRSSVDAFLESESAGESGPKALEAAGAGAAAPTGRRRRRAAEEQAAGEQAVPAQGPAAEGSGDGSGGTGRRRGRPSPVEGAGDDVAPGMPDGVSEGAVVMAGEHGAGTAAVGTGLGGTVPPQGVPVPSGRRARRDGEQHALPAALPAAPGAQAAPGAVETAPDGAEDGSAAADAGQPTGRRRRALAAAAERAAAAQETGSRTVFALPPAEADRSPEYVQAEAQAQAAQAQAAQAQAAQVQAAQAQAAQTAQAQVALAQQSGGQGASGHSQADDGRHDAMRHSPDDDHTPPQPHPVSAPTGRRRARQLAAPDQSAGTPAQALPAQAVPGQPVPAQAVPALGQTVPAQGLPAQGIPAQGVPGGVTAGQPVPPGQPAVAAQAGAVPVAPGSAPAPAPQPWPDANTASGAGNASGTGAPASGGPVPPGTAQPALPAANAAAPAQPIPAPLPPERPAPRVAQPLPAEATPASAQADSHGTQGRAISVRTLGQGVPFARQVAAAQPGGGVQAPTPPPHQANGGGRRRKLGTPPQPVVEQPETAARSLPQGGPAGPGSRLPGATEGAGRSYAIGAPDENAAEGPEPLDGPGGAVEVADQPQPRPVDDELPPEPLDNPRRLLVWPAPDATTQQALSDRGYRPVIVNSREEVDAQIAAFPAALFVDPLTGPITRTALQSLRQAAVAAEVPVLVTAGLGQASREAAYGADPAVLLKALAPRDSEQHPPRVLLIEEHAEIALALTATLERRGMQVARASTDEDAVTLASQMRPNLVVMDLLQVRRRHAGIVDWLRANGQLNRTPLVVYTAAVDPAELPRLAAGESVLFLAERSTSDEVQDRIVDLLARIGTN
ncbi:MULTISPECIES: PAS domain-containing protein [unclassified Streptomyces]|uniref:hybrid sensor histidine kinase/response regulator n=1 Tax=unclassified Streptomyces TaxID=2593676 RepID=UPI0022504CAF|nr:MULTISPECIES: PAS domain-containing protein [unclassified Streptomyces]MCX4989860.1 PAS domain-containing protein [Streptomyces sp. NBC_00568]MCX5004900.1 PAS domain-containing protein [Streptomyces sp. NBC_00638]